MRLWIPLARASARHGIRGIPRIPKAPDRPRSIEVLQEVAPRLGGRTPTSSARAASASRSRAVGSRVVRCYSYIRADREAAGGKLAAGADHGHLRAGRLVFSPSCSWARGTRSTAWSSAHGRSTPATWTTSTRTRTSSARACSSTTAT